MKRKLICLLLVFSLLLLPTAAGASASGSRLGYVTDGAGLLTEDEAAELEATATEIAETYQCGVYIVTMDDFQNYDNRSVYDCAKSVYQDYSLGWGAGYDGVMLLLSMAERDYALIAYGDFGNSAFTDYGRECLEEVFLDNFRDDDWAGGFRDYLTQCESYLADAQAGEPFDYYYDSPDGDYSGDGYYDDSSSSLPPFQGIAISLGLGCLVAAIVCLSMRRKMRSVAKGSSARAYIVGGGVNLRVQEDQFTHITETRMVIQSDNDNNSSGGGTTVDSDGFSGSSGKF